MTLEVVLVSLFAYVVVAVCLYAAEHVYIGWFVGREGEGSD